MANKVPCKNKLQIGSLKNKLSKTPKFTLPYKRKLSSNISENETVDQNDATDISERLSKKLRKSKRFNAKGRKSQTINKNEKVEAFKENSNSNGNDKNIVDQEKLKELPEQNAQISPSVQENISVGKSKTTNDNNELYAHEDMNELNKSENINNEIRQLLYDTILQTDQVITNIPASPLACTKFYDYHSTMENDLQNISETIMNINTPKKINMSEPVNPPIQELKILKIVLEDAYKFQEKQGKFIEEILHEENLDNVNAGVNIKCSKNSQEEIDAYKYDVNINSQEKENQSDDKLKNKENISNSLEDNENDNFEIKADERNQLNESYYSNVVESKTLTINIHGNSCNTPDNSSVSDNSFDEEKCYLTLNTILSNEQPDKNIDLDKNLSKPILENKPIDISDQESQANCDKKSPKSFNKLKSIKKILTIPCMSALDYEKECQQSQASCSMNNTEMFETEKSPHLTAEEEFHMANVSNILKQSTNEDSSVKQNNEGLKTENEDKQICVQELHSNSQIIPNKNRTIEENLVEQEMYGYSENSVDFNKIIQADESKLLNDDTITAVLYPEKFNTSQIDLSSNEDFQVKSITFREKAETDDSDVIPTGVFKHLNEIFEYNEKTTSMLVKDLEPTIPSFEETPNEKGENKEASKLKSITAWIEKKSIFLVTAADCIKRNANQKTSQNQEDFDTQITNVEDKDGFIQKEEKAIGMKEEEINKEVSCTREQPENEINKTTKNSIDELPISQRSPLEETDFSDIENCMEMDDDFALTASQLRMLDADEKMLSQPKNTTNRGQQTDVCGYTYFGNDTVTFEIINQLHYLRESIEYIKTLLETSTSEKKVV